MLKAVREKQDLATELKKYFSEDNIKMSLTDRHAYAGDAGFYYLLPQAIVQPETEEDIQRLFRFSRMNKMPVTFRTGGTSLSGQSITDGVLVDLSKHWRRAYIIEQGQYVISQPGVIGSHLNHLLKPHAVKIGPDPASISAAMVGGIVSNNSSGMCCGVIHNSYHTVRDVRFILPNGRLYDTSIVGDHILFQAAEAKLSDGIMALQKRVLANEALVEKIRNKYKIKNTVGYSLNAFLDYRKPLDIVARLLIGAEGTLAFISEVSFRTIPDKPFKTTGLLFFENPVVAAQAVPALKETDAEALELMDRPALRSVEGMDYCPAMIKDLPPDATAILCEYQGVSPEETRAKLEKALNTINTLPLLGKLDFTEDAYQQAKLWKMRKGMYPSVAAVRAKGTTAMLEDVAVPLENLGKTVTDLQALFAKYGYTNAIIFGHAKEGNLHFLVTQPVNTPEERKVFESFNDELAELIIYKYNGSLKAEHGTGRQIAPYVKDEWGDEAYAIMQEVKRLLDPEGLLNPGVIINEDPKCHVTNMKTMPVVEEEVDRCVECGYCENRCPSRNYTLTPRQRIQIRRSLQRLKAEGKTAEFDTLQSEYKFSGMDTCAVDGMCATDCPVSINTGELIKRLRRENHSKFANTTALKVAKNFAFVERCVKLALRTGNFMNRTTGRKSMKKITNQLKRIAPGFPLWTDSITKPVTIIPRQQATPDIVYFPSCITRMMGADTKDEMNISELVSLLCDRAGLRLFVADHTTGVCCGQLFSSKGFIPAYQHTVNQTIQLLWKWTDGGKVPVLMDVTSCTHSLQTSHGYLTEENKKLFEKLVFIDSIDLAADYLLPRLKVTEKKQRIVFHPVCTTYKMNLMSKLQSIGDACAEKAEIPFLSGCCGMAGDRGFYFPKLTASATRDEVNEVKGKSADNSFDGYYSSGKTCEMALSEASKQNYQSLLYLLRDATN